MLPDSEMEKEMMKRRRIRGEKISGELHRIASDAKGANVCNRRESGKIKDTDYFVPVLKKYISSGGIICFVIH